MTVPLLSLRGISKSYGQIHANRDIDLDVAPRSIHAILGENGAGKSTLMKLIYGVEQPDAGTVIWKGEPLALASPADARRKGIGMVFQHFSLFETLTVVENIRLVVPASKSDLAQRIRALGRDFGLQVDPLAHVHALSVGERQRVEIIRCLMTEPQLLILDEPTSVLPPQSVDKLFETLRRLRDGGVSILFISHKLEEIRAVCDRATILRGGRVTGNVDPRDHDAHDLARMMIGRDMPQPMPAVAHSGGDKCLEIVGLDHRPDDPFAVPLSDVSLTVRAGEILGIAGISGNGQSELAALISGETVLPREKSDRIFMMGKDVGALDAAARRRLGLAFVPEERLGRGAVPEMSLVLNSLLTAHPFGLLKRGLVDTPRAKAFTDDCIRQYDVRTPGSEAEAGALSGGNLQKFIVGREIMLSPKLLFVAQPTWGVDIGAAAAIRRRLVALRNEGVGILVISEELEELFELCDSIQVIHQGRLSPPLVTRDTRPEEIGRYMIGAHSTARKVPA
ncbi:ABC transporter ATP-binding protein [Mesorhizobium sp. M4B.F.Ca.ET.215.01.1.1]|uniref:ABC transporter ATP-binding protein n=1 Tax=unclassified Mesorhizobium TaxID=325217 RepID=UPI000FCABC17|nr:MULTISPECIES: ABC transporter ATP-binding protein [unclassified Mesorhizobium]RUW23469.1 ABC transporter ATP-binding protein [Mesorhizobium sp. M4B.F.Ca.ET.013.02.1.1]RVD40817.1 ABC transporter ATP-binding protein [Mesorhizobium sp. M4B.F.Ca.ET.019.03.1.1]TGQ05342.1 ABC transporter ATP-binding protein [Mesorhizobium sp. M4B.F.Ca.ET.215.01.1.1]TGQ31346.1 ABC transporter ATP-binding protein [Mesorhizobium sp. M00.F.Ca.ET.220.01.1.1]TGQ98197.1 ABC transporter ATP-binding protein [Mesorhizobium